jgi:hypothetical protein
MAEEPALPPTRRRRFGAALAGLGVYLLVGVTALWLPSALGNNSFVLGVVAGILVAGGLTPALTIREWVIAGLTTVGLILAFGVAALIAILYWWAHTPGDMG